MNLLSTHPVITLVGNVKSHYAVQLMVKGEMVPTLNRTMPLSKDRQDDE